LTKISQKICKTKVTTVSDISEKIKEAQKKRKKVPGTYYVSFNS
jgi:hypothetical protein